MADHDQIIPVELQSVVALVQKADYKLQDIVADAKSSNNPSGPNSTWKITNSNTHVVVSTKSGTGLAGDYAPTVHFTESASTVKDLTTSLFWPRAQNGEELSIILLSGDGGVIDMINVLSSHLEQSPSSQYKPPRIIIFPLGTGNALAHSIGSNDGTWGLSNFARGTPQQLPIFKATFSPGARLLVNEGRREEELPKDAHGNPILFGAVVCSWGMHASLVADSDTEEYRKFGVERFKMAAKEALYPHDGSPPHPYQARVSIVRRGETEEKDIARDEHMYILATLVSNLEENFVISPASERLDGHLRLVHFGPTSGDDAMRIMGLAYQGGKHVDDPAVGYEDIQSMTIRFEGREEESRWRRICIDGTIVRVEKDGWVRLEPEEQHVLDVIA